MTRSDLVIVGAGPAGLSAALVAANNGIDTVLLERAREAGGQLLSIEGAVVDLLGWSGTGPELAARFTAGVKVRVGAGVARIERSASGVAGELELLLDDGARISARRVLLATGLTRRRLGIPGEERLREPRRGDGKVVVIGGGDEATVAALTIAEAGSGVIMLVRGALSSRPLYREMLEKSSIEIRLGVTVKEIESRGDRIAVVLEGEGGDIVADACTAKIGSTIALPEIAPPLRARPDGTLEVDEERRTSEPAIFAAGDIVRPSRQRYLAAALADGVVAARAIEADLSVKQSGA